MEHFPETLLIKKVGRDWKKPQNLKHTKTGESKYLFHCPDDMINSVASHFFYISFETCVIFFLIIFFIFLEIAK